MKILQLRFLNLNSLVGEWQIDLTHPAFGNDGIFAITGPTGAGKSTILDAICLALYGRTPRLSKITKSNNEIMSRHCGECFAEVTFETPAGQFRCHWSQHRARKKANGDLQAPRHEIADALSGQIIEATIRHVAQRIEAITGMDFERFTLSMLLAQGSFAAFLQAAPDQRAPILEQITGSAIYSQISMRVHELRGIESNKLETLQAELAGMTLLSTEDETQLKSQCEAQKTLAGELNKQCEQYSQAINWLTSIDSLKTELDELDQQSQSLLKRRNAFKANEKKLEDGNRAQQLAGDYASLCSLRQAQSSEQKTQQQWRSGLPAKIDTLRLAEKTLQQSKQQLLKNRETQKLKLPVIRQTQALDLKIQAQQTSINKAAETLNELKQNLSALQEQREKSSRQLDENKIHLNHLVQWISAHQADETLVDQLSGLQSRFSALRSLSVRCREKTLEQNNAKAQSHNTLVNFQHKTREFDDKQGQLQQLNEQFAAEEDKALTVLEGKDVSHWRQVQTSLMASSQLLENLGAHLKTLTRLQDLLVELHTQHETLSKKISNSKQQLSLGTEKQLGLTREINLLENQVSLLNKIHSLEQARQQLEDGEPCPLCGANEHPYAAGNVPQDHSTIAQLREVKVELKNVDQQLTAYKVSMAEDNKELEQISQRQQETTRQIAEQQAQLQDTKQQLNNSDIALGEDSGLADSLPRHLKDNRDQLDKTSQRLATIEQQAQALAALRGTLDTAKTVVNQLEQQRLTASHENSSAQQTFTRLEQEGKTLAEQLQKEQQQSLAALSVYGFDTLPDDISSVENTLIKRREQWLARQHDKSKLEQDINHLSLQIDHQNQQLSKKDKALEKQRSAYGALTKAQTELQRERRALFDDQNPEREESRLAAAIFNAEQQTDKDSQHFHSASEEATQLNSKIKAIGDSLKNRAGQLSLVEEEFKQSLREYDFVSEADFQSACISEEIRQQLSRDARQLSDEQSGLDARRKDKITRLKTEREKTITERSIEQLKQDLDNTSNQLKLAQQELGACQQKLDDNQKLRVNQQKRATAIDAQKTECERWDNLHLLIGSADGKKYRNFAQGLTFELLVGHANRQLQKMSDRYLLTRDKDEPLELNVVDNYQAGEERSTKNLSGGESFIVSLALALGLSQMASKNVRVDSLFLDEGFGTLDEDALDTALEALSSLQQSGKLIGIISHVSSLKERIGTQIQVSPQTGGRSLISGPGCSRLS